jgi:energy-coupling factor transporter ATP-binding protein EcfA2
MAMLKPVIIPDQDRFRFTPGKIVSIIGPTGIGKSHLVAKILRDRDELIRPTPTNMVYVYNIWQTDLFRQIEEWCPGITFIQGIEKLQTYVYPADRSTILVLDDQQQQLLDSKDFGVQLITVGVHHHNIMCFFIGHTLYPRARLAQLANRNTSYFIIFKNKRSMYECERFGRQQLQLTPYQVRYAYKVASKYTDRSYLLYDLNPETPEFRQLTTNILNTDEPKFFYDLGSEEDV